MGPKKPRVGRKVKQDVGVDEPDGGKGLEIDRETTGPPALALAAISVAALAQAPAPVSAAVPPSAPARIITKKHITGEIELDVVYKGTSTNGVSSYGVTPMDPSFSKSLSRRTSHDSLSQSLVPGEFVFGIGPALPGFDSDSRLQPGDEMGIGCSSSALLQSVVRVAPRDVDRTWELVLGSSEAVREWEEPSLELQSELEPNWKEELSAKATKRLRAPNIEDHHPSWQPADAQVRYGSFAAVITRKTPELALSLITSDSPTSSSIPAPCSSSNLTLWTVCDAHGAPFSDPDWRVYSAAVGSPLDIVLSEQGQVAVVQNQQGLVGGESNSFKRTCGFSRDTGLATQLADTIVSMIAGEELDPDQRDSSLPSSETPTQHQRRGQERLHPLFSSSLLTTGYDSVSGLGPFSVQSLQWWGIRRVPELVLELRRTKESMELLRRDDLFSVDQELKRQDWERDRDRERTRNKDRDRDRDGVKWRGGGEEPRIYPPGSSGRIAIGLDRHQPPSIPQFQPRHNQNLLPEPPRSHQNRDNEGQRRRRAEFDNPELSVVLNLHPNLGSGSAVEPYPNSARGGAVSSLGSFDPMVGRVHAPAILDDCLREKERAHSWDRDRDRDRERDRDRDRGTSFGFNTGQMTSWRR